MPELPDLHIYSQNLKKRILNKKIASVTIGNPYKVNSPDSFCEKLTGTSIEDIVREGKELHFLLANKNSFSVHLMLSGKFSICSQDEAGKIGSRIISLFFEDSQAFVTADYQGLCRVNLNPKILSTVPDALSKAFTIDYFLGLAKKNAYKNVKAVLIDQKLIRGIGNAYVDEILWKAGISPESVLGKIPGEKLQDLFQAIPFVLNEAIQTIRKIAPDIISGEERGFLKVHNPRRQVTEDGDRIIKKTVATKTTYFTEKQELYI